MSEREVESQANVGMIGSCCSQYASMFVCVSVEFMSSSLCFHVCTVLRVSVCADLRKEKTEGAT